MMKKLFKAAIAVTVLFMTAAGCKKNKAAQPDTGLPEAFNVQTQVMQTGITETLNAVYFVNEQIGFIGGVNGGIYRTTNAGQTWLAKPSGINLPVRAFYFTDPMNGFAVGGESSCPGEGCIPPGGFILRTTDAGQTWVRLNFTDPTLISAVYFTGAAVGYCISSTTIYKTTDGGSNWAATTMANLGGALVDVKFTDAQTGYVTCINSKIIRTTDGGASWQVLPTAPAGGYAAIATGNGYTYISGQQKVIKSTNGGATWQLLSNSSPYIFQLQFLDAQNGIGFSAYSPADPTHLSPAIYSTKDGGETWTAKKNITEFGEVRGISFPYKGLGYGISSSALIKITISTK